MNRYTIVFKDPSFEDLTLEANFMSTWGNGDNWLAFSNEVNTTIIGLIAASEILSIDVEILVPAGV